MSKTKTTPAPMPTVVAMSGNQYFDRLLGDIQPTEMSRSSYPHFHVRVGVLYRRPPRHPAFEYVLEMGSALIPNVLAHRPLRNCDNLAFVFPERHMNVVEQREFMHQLNSHPDATAGKIKTVDILTSSPLIIGDFLRDQLRILQFEDDVASWIAPAGNQ